MKFNPKDLQDIVCKKCNNKTFKSIFFIKKVSAIISPTGKDSFVPISSFECLNCGHINEEFLPQGFEEDTKSTILTSGSK